jgi:hypothetical protein
MTKSPTRDTQDTHQQAALDALVKSAAANIPGVGFASITLRRADQSLHTATSTDPLAVELDELQYELREGPCYDAVTDEHFTMTSDLAHSEGRYPAFGPRAAALGVRSQAGIQLEHGSESAGLNLYAFQPNAFDRSTVQLAEMFAEHAGFLLGYARRVDNLGRALQTRQDIGTAVGMMMHRFQVDRDTAFSFLVRISNDRNVKLRKLADEVIRGDFELSPQAQDG